MKLPTVTFEVPVFPAVQALVIAGCSASGALVVGLTFSLVALVLPFTLGGLFTLTFSFGFSFILSLLKSIYLHWSQTSIVGGLIETLILTLGQNAQL